MDIRYKKLIWKNAEKRNENAINTGFSKTQVQNLKFKETKVE